MGVLCFGVSFVIDLPKTSDYSVNVVTTDADLLNFTISSSERDKFYKLNPTGKVCATNTHFVYGCNTSNIYSVKTHQIDMTKNDLRAYIIIATMCFLFLMGMMEDPFEGL